MDCHGKKCDSSLILAELDLMFQGTLTYTKPWLDDVTDSDNTSPL